MIIEYKVKHSRFDKCDKSVVSLITCFGASLFLAGSFFRSWIHKEEKVEDYDIFFTDLTAKDLAASHIEAYGFVKVFTCPLGELITFKNEDGVKIQFITKFQYGSVKSCVGSFDLTACCCGYDANEGKIYCHMDWLADVKRKTISFNDVTFPVASIARIVKYHGKGYRYTGETLKHFVSLIADREFDDDKLGLYVD